MILPSSLWNPGLEATKHRAIRYQRIKPTIADAKIVLALQYPVVFGFTVYESFDSEETAKTGIMPMPKKGEKELDGHAVVLVGYDDIMEANGLKGYFEVRNSFGVEWGQGRYFWNAVRILGSFPW